MEEQKNNPDGHAEHNHPQNEGTQHHPGMDHSASHTPMAHQDDMSQTAEPSGIQPVAHHHVDHGMEHEKLRPSVETAEGISKQEHDHAGMEHAQHNGQSQSGAAHADHTGHEQMFRRKFWISLLLSIPVILYSSGLQSMLGITLPAFPGSQWLAPVFAVVVFFYGGLPFLQMAVPELRNRQPGMMTLISLAISVAFIYSVATLFLPGQMDFFWELVTLIDIMLLGHWIEMRSVRQASGALNTLAKLMPDSAERIRADGSLEVISASQLRTGDRVLVRPGAGIPADGTVIEGESSVNEAMITGESKPVGKAPGAGVIGGSINGSGSLRVQVTATGDQTALAGIMRLVEQAQQSKSRTQIGRPGGWFAVLHCFRRGGADRNCLDDWHRL